MFRVHTVKLLLFGLVMVIDFIVAREYGVQGSWGLINRGWAEYKVVVLQSGATQLQDEEEEADMKGGRHATRSRKRDNGVGGSIEQNSVLDSSRIALTDLTETVLTVRHRGEEGGERTAKVCKYFRAGVAEAFRFLCAEQKHVIYFDHCLHLLKLYKLNRA